MTQVGHILTGVAIGVACMPEQKPKGWKVVYLSLCAFLANVPDLQLPYWGHHTYYYVSHSLFVNLALIGLLLLLFLGRRNLRTACGGTLPILGGALAWLSHLLLDTFYNQAKGLMMFWPFSQARLSLALPWFKVVKDMPPPLTADTLYILLVELAFYGTLLGMVILVRVLLQKGNKKRIQTVDLTK